MKLYKILVISTDFDPLIGGTSRHTSCLCNSLSCNGLDVHLLTYGIDTNGYDRQQNYHIVRINSKNNFNYLYRHLFIPIKLAFSVSKHLKNNDYDLVHVCSGNYIPLPLRFTTVNIPVIWTIHNLPPAEMSTHIIRNCVLNSIFIAFIKPIFAISVVLSLKFGKFNHIISVSEFIQQKLLLKHVPAEKIDVVPNGVEKRISPREATPNFHKKWFTILVIARVVEHKGQLELVKAMPRILAHIPHARCIIAGEIISENYRDSIIEEMKSNSIEDNKIILTGKISDEDVKGYLSDCDIYVQPSYEEGFCIAIAEAMYGRVPVIGTETGAIPTFIGNDRGILLPTPNPDSIADAVIKYFDNPEIMMRYAENGRNYIQQNYDWDAIAKKTIVIYDKVITNRSK